MSTRGVGIILKDATGQPIANATVAFYERTGVYQTGPDGSVVVAAVPVEDTDICVKVVNVPGYQPYLQSPLIPGRDVNVCIGFQGAPSDVTLPPLNPNVPPHAIRTVQAGFCNRHDSVVVAPSTQGRPIFSPYFVCLPPDQQQEWIAIWQAAGMRHVPIMIDDPVYPEGLPQYGGAEYPAPHFAPTVAQFQAACTVLLANGFTPIVFTTTGAVPTDWAAYQSRVQQYCGPFAHQIIAVEGWEPYATNDQFSAWFAAMRAALGPDAILGLHLPSNYIDNGNGDADWTDSGPFAEVDVFLMELAPPQSAADIATMGAGWLQCIQRVIQTPGVDYRFGNRTRPVTPVVFEQVAYYQIREQISDADIDTVMAWDQQQRVQWLGNANQFGEAA